MQLHSLEGVGTQVILWMFIIDLCYDIMSLVIVI